MTDYQKLIDEVREEATSSEDYGSRAVLSKALEALENAQTTLDEDRRHMDRQARRIEENREEIDRLTRSRASAHGLALRMEKRADAAERELRVAEDQANTIAGDLTQAERERDEAWRIANARRETINRLEQEKANVESERDQYAAVVEKVRELPRYRVPDPVMEWGAVDSDDLDHALSSAPADLLREHDARVWYEGAGDMAEHIDNGAWWEIQNPYQEGQS